MLHRGNVRAAVDAARHACAYLLFSARPGSVCSTRAGNACGNVDGMDS